jgi:hypothetical protein
MDQGTVDVFRLAANHAFCDNIFFQYKVTVCPIDELPMRYLDAFVDLPGSFPTT